MAANENKVFKILLIGDGGSGKAELLRKFVEDDVPPSFITSIGIDFKIKRIQLDGEEIRLQMWDTAGQERFRTITTAYYRSAQGLLLVFDLTDEMSFNHIRNWVDNINKHVDPNVPKILIGNRCSQTERRAIESERAQALADELGMKQYIETDSADNTNVEKAFMSLASEIAKSLLAAPEVQPEVQPENSNGHPVTDFFNRGIATIQNFISGGNNPESENREPGGAPSPRKNG